MACVVAALILIVVVIEFFFSLPRPKSSIASQEGAILDEVGGSTNVAWHPRSHLFY